MRLDAVAAQVFPRYSRNRLQSWIKAGYLSVDGRLGRVKEKVIGGECLLLELPPDTAAEVFNTEGSDEITLDDAQPVDFELVYDDEHIAIINKPAGLVMHPAPGNRTGTLLNGLLYRFPRSLGVPRAGIVHRLDKDTSGLCVVAKTLEAHTHLVRQLQDRSMGRRYTAVVVGDVPLNGTINTPIGRHAKDRKKMAVTSAGKEAITHYECVERYVGCAKIQVKLETGRTHQIRVHMNSINHALLGDPVYGRRLAVLPRMLATVPEVAAFKRQALHAHQLALQHPESNETITFEAELPDDMRTLCDTLSDNALRQLPIESKR